MQACISLKYNRFFNIFVCCLLFDNKKRLALYLITIFKAFAYNS